MTGRTHRVGGMLCCLGGYTLLKENGMLLGDVNPLLQLTVMYPFAIYGSVVSDLDHNWQSSPSKDIISYGINKVLHLTTTIREKMSKGSFSYKMLGLFDARHRSWQTHSDMFLVLMMVLFYQLLSSGVSTADSVLIRLVAVGMVLGIISHLVLDMLTPEGIWCSVLIVFSNITGNRFLPKKISLVPNIQFFRTGGTWENIVRIVMWLVCVLLFLMIVLEESPYSIDFLKG